MDASVCSQVRIDASRCLPRWGPVAEGRIRSPKWRGRHRRRHRRRSTETTATMDDARRPSARGCDDAFVDVQRPLRPSSFLHAPRRGRGRHSSIEGGRSSGGRGDTEAREGKRRRRDSSSRRRQRRRRDPDVLRFSLYDMQRNAISPRDGRVGREPTTGKGSGCGW